MAKKVHIICAKCGSDDIAFKIEPPNENDENCGVYITCQDCGELTGVEEWNEFNAKKTAQHES